MKPKINKTITTKGGGNIIIPNKIINKEYPDISGAKEEGIYYVKANFRYKVNSKDKVCLFNEYVKNNNKYYYTFYKIMYESGYLFKDNPSFNFGALGFVVSSQSTTTPPYENTQYAGIITKENIINDSIPTSPTNASVITGKWIYFIATKNELNDLKNIIDNFLDGVEYETNFDLD